MNKFEKLENIADQNNVNIIPYHFESKRIKGLYCDQTIALNEDMQLTVERTCVLAEELGHHHTSSGAIIDLANVSNRKQEKRARAWAYNELVNLAGIVSAYNRGCQNLYDMAEHLEVTEEFLSDALDYYKTKYGYGIIYQEYYICFIPEFAVYKSLK